MKYQIIETVEPLENPTADRHKVIAECDSRKDAEQWIAKNKPAFTRQSSQHEHYYYQGANYSRPWYLSIKELEK